MAGMLKGFLSLQADFLRTPLDLMAGRLGNSWLKQNAPATRERRAVVTLPGFAASTSTHRRLVSLLNHCGYDAQTFGSGTPGKEGIRGFVRNREPSLGVLIKELADRHGTGVALVGQSAGGLYAREFARMFPDEIDRVVTLGSPTADPRMSHLHNRALELLVKRVSKTSGFEELNGPEGLLHWPLGSPAIPYVAICSPVDGAVTEETALIPAETVGRSDSGAPRENIRIRSSHFGMACNPFVLIAVADRLGQDRGNWTDFTPGAYFPNMPAWLRNKYFPTTRGSDGLALARYV